MPAKIFVLPKPKPTRLQQTLEGYAAFCRMQAWIWGGGLVVFVVALLLLFPLWQVLPPLVPVAAFAWWLWRKTS